MRKQGKSETKNKGKKQIGNKWNGEERGGKGGEREKSTRRKGRKKRSEFINKQGNTGE